MVPLYRRPAQKRVEPIDTAQITGIVTHIFEDLVRNVVLCATLPPDMERHAVLSACCFTNSGHSREPFITKPPSVTVAKHEQPVRPILFFCVADSSFDPLRNGILTPSGLDLRGTGSDLPTVLPEPF